MDSKNTDQKNVISDKLSLRWCSKNTVAQCTTTCNTSIQCEDWCQSRLLHFQSTSLLMEKQQ